MATDLGTTHRETGQNQWDVPQSLRTPRGGSAGRRLPLLCDGNLYPSREDWAETRVASGIGSSHDDMHAGELETSVLLAAYPDYVRGGWNTADHRAPDRRHLTTLGINAYTHTGVIGRPSQATKEKGLAALSHLGAAAGTLIGLLARTND